MPDTRYAEACAGDIAYQVFGTGPRDLLYVPGQVNLIESFRDLRWPGESDRLCTGTMATLPRPASGTGRV